MTSQTLQIAFVSERCEPVRSLPGFKSTHRIPDIVDARSEAFVASLATRTINQDLDDVYDAIRRDFRLKRTQLAVSDPRDGTGAIVTPYFTYSIGATLNRKDPSQVDWERRITEIEKPDRVFANSFSKVFGTTFSSLELSPPTQIDVTAFIDHVEELEDERLSIDYDRRATRCSLTIKGIGGKINVTANSIAIANDKPQLPLQLFKSFVQIQSCLSGIFAVDESSLDSVELLLV